MEGRRVSSARTFIGRPVMARVSRLLGPATAGLLQLVAAGALSAQVLQPAPPFDVWEASIPELQEALEAGRVTSVQLVQAYMARIRAFEEDGPELNAIIALNPRAWTEAAALDRERTLLGSRGPLHGIPVLLKDNIDSTELPTSGASFALAGTIPPDDSYLVRRLKEAGAIILGKTNLHELSVGITTQSSLKGRTRNPYDPTRTPGGSSGGTGAAIAASFAALGWGTDTCGSIRIPSSFNALFGLRPTKGLISIDGMIPVSHSQDVVGPMARTVADLAIGMDAVVGIDPGDPSTRILEERPPPHFVEALRTDALRGVRIGVLTTCMDAMASCSGVLGDLWDAQGDTQDLGKDLIEALKSQKQESGEETEVVRRALEGMRTLGAQLVEVPVALDTLLVGTGVTDFEFKFDFGDYLAATPSAPIRSLADILERGLYHPSLEALLLQLDAPRTRDSEEYRNALARREEVRAAVLAILQGQHLDALAYPTMLREPALLGQRQLGSTCHLSSATGLPALTMPAGLDDKGLPVGFELLGAPLDDARLVGFAYAYEQAFHPRSPPPTTPSLMTGRRVTDGGS